MGARGPLTIAFLLAAAALVAVVAYHLITGGADVQQELLAGDLR